MTVLIYLLLMFEISWTAVTEQGCNRGNEVQYHSYSSLYHKLTQSHTVYHIVVYIYGSCIHSISYSTYSCIPYFGSNVLKFIILGVFYIHFLMY